VRRRCRGGARSVEPNCHRVPVSARNVALRCRCQVSGVRPRHPTPDTQRFFQILADGVERFEGFVDKFTGDGIMALFGAPIAHEDHAQRACYAALHLRDTLRRYADELRMQQGLNFSVRTGLNSGEVVVGKIGDDLRMDYTAQGHVVGLA
jgi:hypothetical protein